MKLGHALMDCLRVMQQRLVRHHPLKNQLS